MSDLIPIEAVHPPVLAVCPECGSERTVRRDHPGLEGTDAPCPACRVLPLVPNKSRGGWTAPAVGSLHPVQEDALTIAESIPRIADYQQFIRRRSQLDGDFGFNPTVMPDYLFPFQSALVEWAVRKGRAAIFADCGLGKTLMQLVWAENVAINTGKPVLLLTPLAVAQQTAREAERFGIDAARSARGELPARIVIANYERLHHFSADDFGGVVCDESSILKSFEGVRRSEITEFMRRLPYRLLATATAAPNDYTELGTSSEALGHLGYLDMLSRFFTNTQRTNNPRRNWIGGDEWRLRGHAEIPFWRWVASWARAMRRPSDLGFSDDGFDLPLPLIRDHIVNARTPRAGMLFDLPASGFFEEREQRKRTISERCETAAALVDGTGQPAVVWCGLNPEGDLLERLISDAVQVSGKDSDDEKEEKFIAFAAGEARVMVTKPVIGAWGLNWQHCNHLTYFPSHSYEQYYQAVRRCWRFGQTRQVVIDIIATEGEAEIQANLQRKSAAADLMFASLVEHMRDGMAVRRSVDYPNTPEVPTWLAS